MDRRSLQIIGMPLGIKIKVSFFEDEDDQLCGWYENTKINGVSDGNLLFLIPVDVTKVTIATYYCGVELAIVGQKIEEKIVTRIFFDEWVRKEETYKFSGECKHCGTMFKHIVEYELHQCPSKESQ